jgi:hypothetical protein
MRLLRLLSYRRMASRPERAATGDPRRDGDEIKGAGRMWPWHGWRRAGERIVHAKLSD